MMSGLSATDEKLRIFVSSTINECAAERAIARKAIESLNHTAILFEAVGARPYPPRETYATRLRESDVMVAIYRQEDGWIAEGLSISGVHDEFLIAREARIPVVAYGLRPAPARENAPDALRSPSGSPGSRECARAYRRSPSAAPRCRSAAAARLPRWSRAGPRLPVPDRKSTRLTSSHLV